jgi:hypothetical protein
MIPRLVWQSGGPVQIKGNSYQIHKLSCPHAATYITDRDPMRSHWVIQASVEGVATARHSTSAGLRTGGGPIRNLHLGLFAPETFIVFVFAQNKRRDNLFQWDSQLQSGIIIICVRFMYA